LNPAISEIKNAILFLLLTEATHFVILSQVECTEEYKNTPESIQIE